MHIVLILIEIVMMGASHLYPQLPHSVAFVMFWGGLAGLLIQGAWLTAHRFGRVTSFLHRNATISFRDAAVRLYEMAQGTPFGLEFDRKTPEEALNYAGLYLIHMVEVEAKKPPSTLWQVLQPKDVNRLLVGGGATTLTDIDTDEVLFIEPRLRRVQFERALKNMPGPSVLSVYGHAR